MIRFFVFIAIAITVANASAQDKADPADLIDTLAKSKVYSENSVTMSPDRALLEGFKQWGKEGFQHLQKSMSHESRDVRHHSLLLLAELPGGNDLLLETLKDKSSSVRGDILSRRVNP